MVLKILLKINKHFYRYSFSRRLKNQKRESSSPEKLGISSTFL